MESYWNVKTRDWLRVTHGRSMSLTMFPSLLGLVHCDLCLGNLSPNLFITSLSPKVDPSLMEDLGRICPLGSVCLGRIVIIHRIVPFFSRNI